jgi:hypothetical protein
MTGAEAARESVPPGADRVGLVTGPMAECFPRLPMARGVEAMPTQGAEAMAELGAAKCPPDFQVPKDGGRWRPHRSFVWMLILARSIGVIKKKMLGLTIYLPELSLVVRVEPSAAPQVEGATGIASHPGSRAPINSSHGRCDGLQGELDAAATVVRGARISRRDTHASWGRCLTDPEVGTATLRSYFNIRTFCVPRCCPARNCTK